MPNTKAVRNERIRLMAAWLNGSAIAAVAVGCFAPVTAYVTATSAIAPAALSALTAGWLALSVILHILARTVIGRIEE